MDFGFGHRIMMFEGVISWELIFIFQYFDPVASLEKTTSMFRHVIFSR